MSKIFLSHSSRDKDFVRQLAADLSRLGHIPWLDEWEIRVGECIVTRVEAAIEDADYVVLVLSPNSVDSGWVEKEWKAKYWEEIDKKKVIVLPALIAKCEIPTLLRTKRYADFRESYAVGFANLTSAVEPLKAGGFIKEASEADALPSRVTDLLERLQTPGYSVSSAVAEALAIARNSGSETLEVFCRGELGGWEEGEANELLYRRIEVMLAPNAKLNPEYIGWGENLSRAWEFMRNDHENFIPYTLQVGFSVSSLEERVVDASEKKLLVFNLPRQRVFPDTKRPDDPLLAYARGDSLKRLLSAIRGRLTELLLELLPKASTT